MPPAPSDGFDLCARHTRDDQDLAAAAGSIADGGDVIEQALDLGRRISSRAALLGTDTAEYFSTLATLGSADLTVARAIEPHLDALTILEQARDDDPSLDLGRIGADAQSTWGVYAANAPGHELTVRHGEGGLVMDGSKAWCSLADSVRHALVTARDEQGATGLYAVPIEHPGVEVDSAAWVSRGLARLRTSVITCTNLPTVPVGGPGWYLDRPGFSWGGMAVAAVWFGGARALADTLVAGATRREPDQIAYMHVGAADVALHAARAALEHAAARIDAGEAQAEAGATLALRTRSVVADTVETVLRGVGHSLGPGPLTADETHARRVADLTVYVRQHHAERDLTRLGEHVLRARAERSE